MRVVERNLTSDDGTTYCFFVIHLESTFFVWCGLATERPAMPNLHFAVPGHSQKQKAVSACAFGAIDSEANELCEKLSSKFNAAVYMSLSVERPSADCLQFLQLSMQELMSS
eukprot:Polyplicarium_translucidae@DN118_c0_g1_i1.p2